MYNEHWKLRERPFDNTPDPKFFYASERHQEALSRFRYLIEERKSCGILSGVYGCGKTLMLYALKKETEPKGFKFSLVANPRLDDLGLLRLILRGLKGDAIPAGKADVLMELQRQIENIANDGKHTVVVIDEAHAILNEDVFEELRLLTNFQTETRYLLTLIISGQPELRARVEANKQLNQRVAMRYHLEAFSAADTGKYIRHRLTVAGAQEEIFSQPAVDVIHRLSGGIPRWINHLADMSLLGAFGKGLALVGPEIVEEASQSLSGV